MGKQCCHYSNGSQCKNEANGKFGRCKMHSGQMQKIYTEEKNMKNTPNLFIQYAFPELKKRHASACTAIKDGTGGAYYGGGACDPHVHTYATHCAHVKIGDKPYLFIDQNGNFIFDVWNDGVVMVAKKFSTEMALKLLTAMAFVLSESNALLPGKFKELFDKMIKKDSIQTLLSKEQEQEEKKKKKKK